MDPSLHGFTSSGTGNRLENQSLPILRSQSLAAAPGFKNSFFDQSGGFNYLQSDLVSTNTPSSSTVTHEEHSPEDCDFSDAVLGYISQILMEEDMEDKTCMLQDSFVLQAAEKSLYEVLGEKYPPSPVQNPGLINEIDGCPVNNLSVNYDHGLSTDGNISCIFNDNFLLKNPSEFPSQSLQVNSIIKSFDEELGEKCPPSLVRNLDPIIENERCPDNLCVNYGGGLNTNGDSGISSIFAESFLLKNPVELPSQSLQSNSITMLSCSSSNSVIGSVDGQMVSPNSILQASDLNSENQSIWQFMKGVEEASKFLPSGNDLFANLDVTNFSSREPRVGADDRSVKVEKDEGKSLLNRSRGKKQLHREDGDVEEERTSKQAAVYTESPLRSDMIDVLLLNRLGEGKAYLSSRRDALRNNSSRTIPRNGQSNASTGGRGRGKKQTSKKQVVDLRTLLVLCAQAVAADDHKSAYDLLRQIRQHSTPFGDGNQRLANVFADGLEARLAGSGSQIYKGLVSKRTSTADILKAYHLYLAACPFRKVSNAVSNVTIWSSTENSMRVHVIDFGILYGFQWPTLIQNLSLRTGGLPKLRITGIDFPQPGFRPAERVEETGRRLAAYADGFNLPFEFNAIAKKWHTIQLEELKIDKDEFLVVTCFNRGKNLLDESVEVESPRDTFLNLIKTISPDLFIHGIINGSFTAPFFVTRFREALFHYSSLFDMLETIVPREEYERMLIEKEIFGREALNAIACEGSERVERPETYKQWQARILRAGFVQHSFSRELVQRAMKRVRIYYHKDFIIDEDNQWLLQGWKGRIIYALSCWKPA